MLNNKLINIAEVKTRPPEISQEKSGIANNSTKLLKLSEIDSTNPLLLTFNLASNEVLIGEIRPNKIPNPNKLKQSPINANQPLINKIIVINNNTSIANTSDSSETIFETTLETALFPNINPTPKSPIKLPIVTLLS